MNEPSHDAANTDRIHRRLAELNLLLPPPHPPAGTYVGAVITANQLWVAGVGPTMGSEIRFSDRVGDEINLDAARTAVKLTLLNLLTNANVVLGGQLERIERCLKCLLLVRAVAGFREGFNLAETASELFAEILGPQLTPAMSVTTAPALPVGISCEMDAVFEIR